MNGGRARVSRCKSRTKDAEEKKKNWDAETTGLSLCGADLAKLTVCIHGVWIVMALKAQQMLGANCGPQVSWQMIFSQTPEQVRVKSSSECCSGKFTKQIYADANVLLCKWISSSLPHFGLNKCNGTELHSCEWESNYIIAYLLFKWQRFSKVHMLESVIIF